MNEIFQNNKLFVPVVSSNYTPFAIECFSIEVQELHFHDSIEIIFVIKGSVTLRRSQCTYSLLEGDFVIINPTELHGIYNNNCPNLVMLMHLDPKCYEYSNYFFACSPDFYRNFVPSKVALAKSHMAEVFILNKINNNPSKAIAVSEKFLTLIKENFLSLLYVSKISQLSSFKENKQQLKRLQSVLYYIVNYFDQRITLDELTKVIFINKFYLSKLINEGFKCSLSELIAQVRTCWSELFLLGSNLSITDISDKLGFASHEAYVNSFRKIYGMKPSEFKKRLKNKTCANIPFRYGSIYPEDEIIDLIKNAVQPKSGKFQSMTGLSKVNDVFFISIPYREKNETLIFLDNSLNAECRISLHLSQFMNDETCYVFIINLSHDEYDYTRIINSTDTQDKLSLLKDLCGKNNTPDSIIIFDKTSQELLFETTVAAYKAVLFVVRGSYLFNIRRVKSNVS